MSARKALKFLDKREIKCAICSERFTEPKTLKCLHSYCLHCLESLMQTHSEMMCPKCNQHHDLKKEDLENLTSNPKISYALEYVRETEYKKPHTCSKCDNQPKYNCFFCQLYLCGECTNDHEMFSALKDHPIYILDNNEEEYQGSEDWQILITDGAAHVKESPVSNVKVDTDGAAHVKESPVSNVKVETLGLVNTINIISVYKEHELESNVTDVALDRDGCMLVSSCSKSILKFSQSGSFITRIQVPQDVQVCRMHQMGDGHMVYSDSLENCVVMCDDKFQEIRSFGKGILKYPKGLTVNKETRIMYVADREAHCVFKFNIDDGRLLGTIGSDGRMKGASDVILTKEGHVIVAEFDNRRLRMFDASEKFMRILVGSGTEDGEVWGPLCVTIDKDENIIVSSNHKLQLFDKNGVFIKRIDHKDDGLDTPAGISVISNRPRRVAVANHEANNVKIFNY